MNMDFKSDCVIEIKNRIQITESRKLIKAKRNSIQSPQIRQTKMNIFPSSSTKILCLEQTETIRLQRLIQQRKRMQHMAQLIQKQSVNIEILTRENESMSKQYSEIRLRNQLLNDKLMVADNHGQQLSQIVTKQVQLIESFRQLLRGQDLHINEVERRVLLEEIEASVGMWYALGKDRGIKDYNYRNVSHQSRYREQIATLTEQNQQLTQKYQQLCKNYLQVTKQNKIKQFQLIKHLQSSKHNGHKVKSKKTSSPQLNSQAYNQMIISRDKNITLLQTKIQQLNHVIHRKDQLIKEHRKNQVEQKRLLHFIKNKFVLEGKQLLSIANSNPSPTAKFIETTGYIGDNSQVQYDMDTTKYGKCKKKDKGKKCQDSPKKLINMQETANNPIKNSNLNAQENSTSPKKLTSKNLNINEPISPGFKRTVMKNTPENNQPSY